MDRRVISAITVCWPGNGSSERQDAWMIVNFSTCGKRRLALNGRIHNYNRKQYTYRERSRLTMKSAIHYVPNRCVGTKWCHEIEYGDVSRPELSNHRVEWQLCVLLLSQFYFRNIMTSNITSGSAHNVPTSDRGFRLDWNPMLCLWVCLGENSDLIFSDIGSDINTVYYLSKFHIPV